MWPSELFSEWNEEEEDDDGDEYIRKYTTMMMSCENYLFSSSSSLYWTRTITTAEGKDGAAGAEEQAKTFKRK